MVSHIDLALDERTNELGTQLATGQSEADVPGGEPDILFGMVSGSCCTSCFGLALMPPECPLQMDMSGVPHPLALLKPMVNSWNL